MYSTIDTRVSLKQALAKQGVMSAKTYKNKLAEPLVQKLKSLVKTALIRCFEAYDSYYRLNITNGNLHHENERLTKTNEKLAADIMLKVLACARILKYNTL